MARKQRTIAVQAEAFTFGVEIECGIPTDAVVANNIRVGYYHRGEANQAAFNAAGLHRGWNIQRDASVNFRGNVTPVEIASPILQGADGIEQVVKMLDLLKSWGTKVNASCGLHVTVGHELFRNDHFLCQLILSMYRFNDAMVAVGSSFSRRGGVQSSRTDYGCSLVARYGTNVCRKTMGDANFARHFSNTKYQALNLNRAKTLGIGEFRLFAGTLNTSRMLAAIWSSLAICQYAASTKKLSKAVIDIANYGNETYYQKNVEHMFRLLAWKEDNGAAWWQAPLGVIRPAMLDADQFDRVLAKVRSDAARMDEENARHGYRHRVAPKRAARRANRQEGAPSPTGEGE